MPGVEIKNILPGKERSLPLASEATVLYRDCYSSLTGIDIPVQGI